MTAPTDFSKQDYEAFAGYLEEACGILLGAGKTYLVRSRLHRLLAELGLDSLAGLVERARNSSPLRERIIDAMTTNETLWFRDGHPFDLLARRLLPEFSERRLPRLRIWSAGCSSGEEPYSVAMMLREFQATRPMAMPADIQVVATDISGEVLDQARSGLYDERSLSRGVSEERRRRHFQQKADRWQVRDEVRQLVAFRPLNLKDSFSLLGRFDVIYCRNVLIYFSAELKRDIVSRMAAALNPGGYLILGAAESPTSYCDRFQMVRCDPGVIYRLK